VVVVLLLLLLLVPVVWCPRQSNREGRAAEQEGLLHGIWLPSVGHLRSFHFFNFRPRELPNNKEPPADDLNLS
jgi:hypothetical protein